MSQRRWLGSVFTGLPLDSDAEPGYPGEALGLPKEGPGSAAGFGRRLGAVLVDWALALTIAQGLIRGDEWLTLGVFALMYVVLLPTLGHTIGQRLFRLRVTTLTGGRPGLLWTLARTALLCLAVPALFIDHDNRGLHDRASATLVVRT
ncbi:MAG: RDD family protein [Streptosporangiales bacterium]|nr:RDD family protein [Streptosporangiales bacterium]